MRVAVVGGGVSGLAAAHELLAASGGDGVRVTLYEEEDRLGGRASTVAVDDGAGRVHLDLGFLIFNQVTYSHMMEWLEGLGVEMERSDMSFSVSTQSDGGSRGCEWGNGNGISSLLAQKANILKTSFWRMVREILKFKNDALTYLEYHEHNPDVDCNETLGQFIQSHGYSLFFQEAYLIPVCAGLWPFSFQGVLSLSAFFVLSFFRNHDLLQLFRYPQLPTVKALLQSVVDKVKGELESMGCRIKTSCRVKSVSSFDGAGHRVLENDGSEETYDSVILGVHAPNALKVLGAEATHYELKILGACQYVHRDIYLHCDQNLMPRNSSAWSAWNFLGTTSRGFSVTYWLNHIQAGKATAQGLLGKKSELLLNPKQMIPSWTRGLGLVEEGGSVFSFGKACDKCRVKSVMRVHDPLFYWKIATEGNLGLAEAYINGCFSFLDKREGLLNLILSNEFFSLFMDKSMTYSCAIFKMENESLEAAQERKLRLLLNKAKVERGHHVLDIGFGWGSLAIQVVKQTGCKYTGVTLSEEQLKYAQGKAREAGLEEIHVQFDSLSVITDPPYACAN
uniref:Cyclopropane-fatty-acyl-phospholipid synthase n=1 Tax=Aegilops tauschii TaxID=37682 RepID=R7VZ12_AEGTA